MDICIAWYQSSQNLTGTIYDDAQFHYKNLNILWLSKKLQDLTISTLNIIDGYQDTANAEIIEYRSTNGLIFIYNKEKIRVATRGFYQWGKLQFGNDVSAYYLSGDFTYKLFKHVNVTAGFELMSGNNGLDSLNTTSHAFSILYGGRHKFNGRMDYFSTPATTLGAGLIDPYLKVKLNVVKDIGILIEYHNFFLQNNFVHNGKVIDKYLGHEIDLTISKSIKKYLHLSGGYSIMFATPSMEVIKGGSRHKLNNWAFIMITVNPTFFKSNV